MPWVTLDTYTMSARTETEHEVYMRGAKLPEIDESMPECLTQAELAERLTTGKESNEDKRQ